MPSPAQRIILAELDKQPMTASELSIRLGSVDVNMLRNEALFPLVEEGLITIGQDNYYRLKEPTHD